MLCAICTPGERIYTFWDSELRSRGKAVEGGGRQARARVGPHQRPCPRLDKVAGRAAEL